MIKIIYIIHPPQKLQKSLDVCVDLKSYHSNQVDSLFIRNHFQKISANGCQRGNHQVIPLDGQPGNSKAPGNSRGLLSFWEPQGGSWEPRG